jgi:hypothetical protein
MTLILVAVVAVASSAWLGYVNGRIAGAYQNGYEHGVECAINATGFILHDAGVTNLPKVFRQATEEKAKHVHNLFTGAPFYWPEVK